MRNKLIAVALAGFGAISTAASAAALQATQPATPDIAASAVQPSEALRTRASQVVELLNGQRPAQDFFIPEAPIDRFNSRMLPMVRERFGAAVGISGLEATTPHSGVVVVDMERGQLRLRLAVAEEPPHLVNDFGRAP